MLVSSSWYPRLCVALLTSSVAGNGPVSLLGLQHLRRRTRSAARSRSVPQQVGRKLLQQWVLPGLPQGLTELARRGPVGIRPASASEGSAAWP